MCGKETHRGRPAFDEPRPRPLKAAKRAARVEHEDNDASKPVKSARFTETTANLARYLSDGGGKVVFPDETKEEYVRMSKTP